MHLLCEHVDLAKVIQIKDVQGTRSSERYSAPGSEGFTAACWGTCTKRGYKPLTLPPRQHQPRAATGHDSSRALWWHRINAPLPLTSVWAADPKGTTWFSSLLLLCSGGPLRHGTHVSLVRHIKVTVGYRKPPKPHPPKKLFTNT